LDAAAAFLERARAQVDAALERYLPSPPDCPPLLAEAMRYSVLAGGKRLRPLLALAAADATAKVDRSGPPPASALELAMPAACALELIHTYSLVHDDLPAMDNDTLRRGRPTLHVLYGDGIAVLAGDALLTEAFVLMARYPAVDDPAIQARKLRAASIVAVAAGATGMVGGQAIDLQAAGQVADRRLTLEPDSLRGMHERKTGALIRASATVGAVMAGADAALVGAVSEFGASIGLAFQIVDDILDVEGNAGVLGKTAGKDAADHKPTYPALFGLQRSKAMAAEYGERARAILERHGLSDTYLPAIANWIVNRKS
jgi:geranylgeranyl pyrophosphate synthase